MEISEVQGVGNHTATAPVTPTREQAEQNREVVQAVKAINQTVLLGQNSELTFALDRETRRPVTRLVDRATREVIQQFPPEYVLRMAEELNKIYG